MSQGRRRKKRKKKSSSKAGVIIVAIIGGAMGLTAIVGGILLVVKGPNSAEESRERLEKHKDWYDRRATVIHKIIGALLSFKKDDADRATPIIDRAATELAKLNREYEQLPKLSKSEREEIAKYELRVFSERDQFALEYEVTQASNMMPVKPAFDKAMNRLLAAMRAHNDESKNK